MVSYPASDEVLCAAEIKSVKGCAREIEWVIGRDYLKRHHLTELLLLRMQDTIN